jgi:predicted porin
MAAGMSSIASQKSIAGLDGTNSNLLNFAAVEDLGGGLKATANIGIRFDVNQASTNASGFGKPTGDTFIDVTSATLGGIRVGTFTSYTAAPFSAFATWNVARTDNQVSAVSVNQVRYQSPTFSGFAVRLSSFTPFVANASSTAVAGTAGATNAAISTYGQIGNASAKAGNQVQLTYANGPATASFMMQNATYANTDTAGVTLQSIDGTYDFKVVKLFAQTWTEKKKNDGVVDNKGYGLSANVPVGPALTLKVGIRRFATGTINATANVLADRNSYGATYALSKRTTAVVLVANDTAYVGKAKTTNSFVGFTHSF